MESAARLASNAAIMVSLSARQLAVETQSELNTLSDRIEERARMLQRDIDRLGELDLGSANLGRVQEVHRGVVSSARQFEQILREIIILRATGVDQDRLELLLGQRSELLQRQEILSSEFTTLLSTLARTSSNRMSAFKEEVAARSTQMLSLLGIIAVMTSASVLAVYFGIRRHVLDRLQGLMEVLQAWQAGRKPDFPDDRNEDEIAGLTHALRQLMDAVDRRTMALVEQTVTDPLTDMLNRRGFETRASREIALAERRVTPVSVMLGDIDFFKAVNDQYGHAAGDHVLSEVAERWRDAVRSTDLCGRLGGEEFAVLLPNTNVDRAERLAERVRNAIAETAFPIPREGAEPIRCTMSIGVAGWSSGEDLAAVLRRADDALYEAKRAGRNRVVVAESAERLRVRSLEMADTDEGAPSGGGMSHGL